MTSLLLAVTPCDVYSFIVIILRDVVVRQIIDNVSRERLIVNYSDVVNVFASTTTSPIGLMTIRAIAHSGKVQLDKIQWKIFELGTET
jgi:hypothetical protein